MSDDKQIHDVVMIGAGPAALTAAIYTTREDIGTVLFERAVIGGLAAVTDMVDNYPGFPDGMAIGQHGSWNRSTLSGYKLVFVPFADGRPAGPPRDILSGFLAPDEKESYGRPVGVTIGPGGRSLLMADDVGNVIWRVTGE